MVGSIISQYEKFGWTLHHVLLSPESKRGSLEKSFSGVDVVDSDIDAAWFSRPAENGRVAFELRSLAQTPFALVDSADPDASESELAEMFAATERKLRERLSR